MGLLNERETSISKNTDILGEAIFNTETGMTFKKDALSVPMDRDARRLSI
jgi:hypothetical protein